MSNWDINDVSFVEEGTMAETEEVRTARLAEQAETRAALAALRQSRKRKAANKTTEQIVSDAAEEAANQPGVPTDLLHVALKDVGRYEVLKHSELLALYEEYLGDDEEASAKAKEIIINSNLRMVYGIASKYHKVVYSQGVTYLDLAQEGTLGLIRAVEKFDPSRGFRFSTYATWWIKQAIRKALQEKTRLIKVPPNITDELAALNKLARRFYLIHGRSASYEELAIDAECTADRVAEIYRITAQPVSLDQPTKRDDSENESLSHQFADLDTPSAYELVEEQEHNASLYRSLELLTWRERKVVEHLYGLNGADRLTMTEVGMYFGLTHQAISIVHRGILTKLGNSTELNGWRDTESV